nr:Protein dennd6b [Polyrhizophydium stewartii]
MATSLTPPESNVEAVSPELVALLGPNASPMNEALLRLNLGSFWQWVFCFCLVNFDLELGQAIELIYPPIEFSETEKQTIAFSAFPDSNSSEHVGDSCFTFRIRNSNFCKRLYLKEHYPSSQQSSQQQNRSPQPALSTAPMAAESAAAVRGNVGLPVDTDGYTYGFVFFRQQVDKEVRRGYLQKSLVLLTPHPWPGLFLNVVSLLGPELMSSLVADRRTNARTQDPHAPAFQGMALLESACFNVASWPAPPSSLSPELSYFSTVLLLPFLGRALRYSFPPTPRFPQLHELPRQGAHEVITGGTDNLPPALCTPGNFYPLFESSPELLWTCWELMVIGEPIMVVGDTPRSCSELVWALVELIKPIPFGGDFRPYFTIQDSDNQHLTNRTRGQPVQAINNMIRRHFTELTDRFLQPLNRYFESLVVGNPAQMTLSCLRSRPEIKPFRQDTFLRQIEQSDLYRLFLKSPSFAAWLQHRTAEVGREWRQKYFDTICAADIDGWARARLAAHSDVECIDLLLRLRDELDKFSCFFVVEDNHVRYANYSRMRIQLETLLLVLPHDLRLSLLKKS